MKITRTADVINIEKHTPSKFEVEARELLLNEVSENDLRTAFQTEMAGMIEKLYQFYLKEKALEKACEEYPVLNKSIWETELPRTVQQALDQNLLLRMKDIVVYDKKDLAALTSLSATEIDLIDEYLRNNGVQIG